MVAARKSIFTVYYRLLGCTSKNKAKTAAEAKPAVEIWRRPKKINFLTLVSYSLLQTVFS